MKLPSLEKVVFVTSLSILALFYGIAAHARGWFPAPLLNRAWHQARQEFVAPLFVADRVFERQGTRAFDSARIQPGFTLISTFWQEFDWTTGVMLIDEEGRTLHKWNVRPARIFEASGVSGLFDRRLADRNVFGTYLFPNGDLLVNLNYVGTARLDGCGDLLWSLPAGTHHSIGRASDGTFWIPAIRESPPTDTLPGLDPSYANQLLQISADGQILRRISVLTVLFRNGLHRYIPRTKLGDQSDITHLNDIDPLPDSLSPEYPFETGDLLISLRDVHLVVVLDPETKIVKWWATEPFIRQHDPDWMGDGWIGVFDNNTDGTEGGAMLGGSRIVAIHTETDSVRTIFPTENSDEFYTAGGGKWQRLSNGNLLLTESRTGRILEAAPDGHTVWEWTPPPYSKGKIAEVTEGTRYELSEEQVAAWPCSQLGTESNGRPDSP